MDSQFVGSSYPDLPCRLCNTCQHSKFTIRKTMQAGAKGRARGCVCVRASFWSAYFNSCVCCYTVGFFFRVTEFRKMNIFELQWIFEVFWVTLLFCGQNIITTYFKNTDFCDDIISVVCVWYNSTDELNFHGTIRSVVMWTKTGYKLTNSFLTSQLAWSALNS
jgi:hypothetical protein